LRSFALEIHFSGNRSRLGEIGSNSLRCLLRRRSLVGGLLGSGGSSTAGEGNRRPKIKAFLGEIYDSTYLLPFSKIS